MTGTTGRADNEMIIQNGSVLLEEKPS